MTAPARLSAATQAGAAEAALVPAGRLAEEPEAWDALVGRALHPHPHYSRHVIESHRAAGLALRDLACIAVRREGRLAAVLPYELALDITGFGRRVATPFRSPFVTATTPLVAGGPDLADTLAALVRGLQSASSGRAWRWPLLSIASPVGRGLIDAMREAGWTLAQVSSFERPVLDRRASHQDFLADHPHKSRLKDLRRRQRRLTESGDFRLVTAVAGEPLAEALDRFLALEAAGWKGRAGTALRCHARTEAFARQLFREGDGVVSVRADTLEHDGKPLAVSLALIAGGTACLLKTTYDEAARAHAPGLVLEAEIVRALHETGFAERLDSATLPGSALESLYRDRETIAEIVAVPPGASSLASAERRASIARFEHRAREEAKRLLGRR